MGETKTRFGNSTSRSLYGVNSWLIIVSSRGLFARAAYGVVNVSRQARAARLRMLARPARTGNASAFGPRTQPGDPRYSSQGHAAINHLYRSGHVLRFVGAKVHDKSGNLLGRAQAPHRLRAIKSRRA